MIALASFVFGFLALFVLGNVVQSRRAQALVQERVSLREREEVRRGLGRSAVVGLCFAIATLGVWWSWPFALVLGGWPIVLFALLAATGNVTVIHRLSTGE